MNSTFDKHTNKVESNFINPGIASLDSCKICQVSFLNVNELLAELLGCFHGALGLHMKHFGNLCSIPPEEPTKAMVILFK